MKITVDREEKEDGLVFIIKVSEPSHLPIWGDDLATMIILDKCKQMIETQNNEGLIEEVLGALHGLKERRFTRAKDKLTFSIFNSLRPKIDAISQEIYNWAYDRQPNELKVWMQEFDPQRTKYYFDNDKTIESEEDYDEG